MVGVWAAATRGILALDVVVLCGVAGYAARRRAEPGAVPFCLAALTLAVAAAAVAVIGRIGGPTSLSWAVLASLLLVFVTTWLWFVVSYTRLPGFAATRTTSALAAVPVLGVVTFAYLYATGAPIPRLPTARGPLYVVFFSVPMIVVGAAFFASVLALLRAGSQYLSASFPRTVALGVGALGGGVLPLLFVSVEGSLGTNPAPGFAFAGLIASGGFSVATVRYDLFESVPIAEAIGRDRLVAAIDDLVVVVDGDRQVVDVNPAAEEALGTTRDEAVGRSVRSLLGVSGPLDAIETVEREGEDGRHVYAVSRSPVSDETGRVVGHALVLRDVTDRQTRQQRLQVLNRVLRHNLRNDMTTLMGYADLLAEDDTEAAPLVDRIHETAGALTDLGDKAREIEQLIAASTTEDASTDLDRIVQYVAAEARKRYPEATVRLDLADGPVVAAAEDVCWPICWNLVENALDHHDGDPTVTIGTAVEAADDRAVLTVTDDGPGMPENERQAIDAGTETPLSHGSGLGLWAVKWGANRVGGAVDIADVAPRGTRVTVRLPLAQTATGSPVDSCEGV